MGDPRCDRPLQASSVESFLDAVLITSSTKPIGSRRDCIANRLSPTRNPRNTVNVLKFQL
jgi:hypothetical protein